MKLNTKPWLKIFLLGGALLLGGASCHKTLKSDMPVFTLHMGGREVQVEVANKPATRFSGLMYRRELDEDTGMLFIFPDSARRAFWMKNTLIPLSVAFIDEKGVIENILEMPPETEQNFLSNGPAKFVLEMNTGWYTKRGVKPGDSILDVLKAPTAVE